MRSLSEVRSVASPEGLPPNPPREPTAKSADAQRHWLRLAPRLLFAVAFGAGVILFAPNDFALTLGLDRFWEDQRALLGVVFIVSAAAWFSQHQVSVL